MLVLASGSPRRREILLNAGLSFVVRTPAVPVEEFRLPGESPESYVRRLAQSKAEAVELAPEETVLGADTVVVLDGTVLEKPADGAHAEEMLRLLSGRTHEVITGICLRSRTRCLVDTEITHVRLVDLKESEIQEYAHSGEPLDKAGGYAIQGLASKFIDRVEGCYFNVVGLPVARVYRHLRNL